MRKTILLCLLFLISCERKEEKEDHISTPGIVYGEVFVSPDGDDQGDGSLDHPWLSISLAISRLGPGAMLTILEGTYQVVPQIKAGVKGTADSIITVRGEPGGQVILDFNQANVGTSSYYPYTRGAVQIEKASHMLFRDLKLMNSHNAGFNMVQSDHISIINCVIENTFSSGIAGWQGCTYITVMGNTIINANDKDMVWGGVFTGSEPPHEALSIAGPHYFEVAWNLIRDCQKEGIDCKETCAHGIVHHNYVHDLDRQGLYIDAWFDTLQDIEMHDNVVHDCEAGIAVSCEDGPVAKYLQIHHNLVFNNRATGLFFSRWGENLLREDVRVYNNTFYRNGYGGTMNSDPDYWLTGGMYLFSTNLRDIIIRNNILSRNKPFELGRSGDYQENDLAVQNIIIDYNLINDVNTVSNPFYMATWTKDWVYSITGNSAVAADPLFADAAAGDFRLESTSPAINAGNPGTEYNDPDGTRNDIGAFSASYKGDYFWWKNEFPPVIDDIASWAESDYYK